MYNIIIFWYNVSSFIPNQSYLYTERWYRLKGHFFPEIVFPGHKNTDSYIRHPKDICDACVCYHLKQGDDIVCDQDTLKLPV